MDLVRDVLDKQLVDRKGEPMGKADGIILLVRDDGPPVVSCIVSGGTTLPRRLHRRLGRWARAAARRWGLRRGRAAHFAWSRVKLEHLELRIDTDADTGGTLAWEHWLREKVIRFIPWSN